VHDHHGLETIFVRTNRFTNMRKVFLSVHDLATAEGQQGCLRE
jgi:hypothetical protein